MPLGFGGEAPDAAAILQHFQKILILVIFWSKFLLKSALLNG